MTYTTQNWALGPTTFLLEIPHKTPFVRPADLPLCLLIVTEAIRHLTVQFCNLSTVTLIVTVKELLLCNDKKNLNC